MVVEEAGDSSTAFITLRVDGLPKRVLSMAEDDVDDSLAVLVTFRMDGLT